MNERITIDTADGGFGAYVARPAAACAPAVVVIQEIFGVNADIRAHCDALAAKGYLAIAPDLFWRLEPGVELGDGSKEEWARAMALYKRFDVALGVSDVAATMAAARSMQGASGKVGVMGFCMGGLLAFLSAARSGPDAAVAYYGGRTSDYVDEFDSLTTPLLMHLAGADQYIPQAAQAAIIEAAATRPNVTVHVYPGRNHAFARVDGEHFDAQAAALAQQRTDAFFAAWLRS